MTTPPERAPNILQGLYPLPPLPCPEARHLVSLLCCVGVDPGAGHQIALSLLAYLTRQGLSPEARQRYLARVQIVRASDPWLVVDVSLGGTGWDLRLPVVERRERAVQGVLL